MLRIVLQFGTFSDAQMIFFSIIMFTTLFAAVKIRSLVAIIAWLFSGIALVGIMAFNLDMIYFWFSLILVFISITVGMSVRTLYSVDM